jgi:hypothetical protein
MSGLTSKRRLCAGFLGLLSAALVSAVPPAAPQSVADTFEAVRKADMDFARVGWRLATANVALCDRVEAGTGLQLHTLDQFGAQERESAARHFGFETPVAIEGVIAGSPAEKAGLKQDDSLVRIGGLDIRAAAGKPGTTDRLVATQLAIADLPAEAPIQVEVLRAGQPLRFTVHPVPACRSRFELELGSAYTASADGAMVQISAKFLENYPEDQFAAVTAHELSHNILHHRARLEARGVSFGLLSGLGGNVKYFRQTEIEADLLSLYLLANAGYPVQSGPGFWRKFGPSGPPSFLRSRTHPHWRDRIATMDAEIAKIEAISARPIVPALLAERAAPLSGDWQALLVRKR